VWWRYGVEARGQNLEELAAAVAKPREPAREPVA